MFWREDEISQTLGRVSVREEALEDTWYALPRLTVSSNLTLSVGSVEGCSVEDVRKKASSAIFPAKNSNSNLELVWRRE